MKAYFEASHKNVKARISSENAAQAEELRGRLCRQGVQCGPVQEADRSFYRPLDEVKRSRQILEVLTG